MKSVSKLFTTILVIIVCLLWSHSVIAQSENVADTWVIHVKDGQTDKFEAAFKKHMAVREKADDPREWTAHVSIVGDDIGHYVIRSCCGTWAEHDSYEKWGASNKIGEHWNNNVDRYVERYTHNLDMVDFENSNWPEDESAIRFIGVRAFYVKPGRANSLHIVKNRMSQAAKTGNWSRYWGWVDSSGGADRLLLASPYNSYAEMAPPDTHFLDFLGEQLGSSEAAQKAWSAFTSSYTHSEYSVYRVLPDLSSAAYSK